MTTAELKSYLMELHKKNRRLTVSTKWSKHVAISIMGCDGKGIPERTWFCHVGNGPLVCSPSMPGDGSFKEEYRFTLCNRLLRHIIEGKTSWEDAVASMRVRLHRSPDNYDMNFMIFFRYGDKPQITQGVAQADEERRKKTNELIEHPDLPGTMIQRYCPHQGEDLKNATIVNGVITCPRHFWQFDANTGKCISGGNVDLCVKKFEW